MKYKLGEGRLSWDRSERVSDRYGTVAFEMEPPYSLTDRLYELVGQKGTLVAVVKETRPSYHMGDWFHNVFPSTPNVGEEIRLGTGTLFLDDTSAKWGSVGIGVKPDDGRETLWMDIHALYRVHSQTVELYFEMEV